MRVPVETLLALAKGILIAHGTPEAYAEIVADHLVSANVSGVDSHGVSFLTYYVQAIELGEIHPEAGTSLVSDRGATAIVRGNMGFGQVSALFATELAIRKAHDEGMGAVALLDSHHVGRLGHYVERAADEKTVLMIWGGGQGVELPQAVPYGGARAILHTNPIAIGFPAAPNHPFVLDFATSATSGGKVRQARIKGESVPAGVLVDKSGKPTTDPNALFDGGAHVPFGGHKGYAMMLAAELLGRTLLGADTFATTEESSAIFRHSGNLFIALPSHAFTSHELCVENAASLLDSIRKVPPADGFTQVLVPGDPEFRARQDRMTNGIPLDESLWDELQALAEDEFSRGQNKPSPATHEE